MTTEAELLQRILDAPDDDAPRLVYADWLIEQNDPRGELIQLQCRYAAESDDARKRAIKIAENKLMKAHEAAWTTPLVALLPPQTWLELYAFEWSRGFIEHARITLACMPLLGELLARAPLLCGLDIRPNPSMLDAAAVEFPKLDGALETPLLEKFTTLVVGLPGGGNLVAHEIAIAATLRNVTRLGVTASVWGDQARFFGVDLEQLVLTELGVRSLAQSPNLAQVRHLHLDSNRITLEGVKAIAHGRWRLETLDIGHNALEPEGLVDALDGPALAELRVLRLAGNAIAPAEAARLAGARALANLRELDLESCALGAKGTEAFCKAFALPALRRLRLERNSLGDAGGKAIAQCAGLAALTSFEAGHNRMGVKAGTALATSPHLAKLERLLLNEPRWKPEMTALFAGSKTLANTKIYLKGRLVGRETRAAAEPVEPAAPEPKKRKPKP